MDIRHGRTSNRRIEQGISNGEGQAVLSRTYISSRGGFSHLEQQLCAGVRWILLNIFWSLFLTGAALADNWLLPPPARG